MSKRRSNQDSRHEAQATHDSNVALIAAALMPFNRTPGSAQDMAQLVDISLHRIVSAFSPDLVLLMLRQAAMLPLIAAYPSAIIPLFQDTRLHSVGECLCGLAVSEEKSIYSGDILRDLRCTRVECKRAGYSSFAALPLRGQGGVLGVLAVGSVRQRDFAEESASLETMAAQLGRTLDKALQKQQAQDR